MKPLLAAALLALGVAAAAPARAQNTPVFQTGTAWHARDDLDRDGRVTLDEARAAASLRFDQLDQDHDGQLTPSEVNGAAQRWHGQRWLSRFDRLDRNRDGQLTPTELGPRYRRLAPADHNHDGQLSRTELQAHTAREASALPSTLWRQDLNHDFVLTRTELLTATSKRFARKDRDRDGVVVTRKGAGPGR